MRLETLRTVIQALGRLDVDVTQNGKTKHHAAATSYTRSTDHEVHLQPERAQAGPLVSAAARVMLLARHRGLEHKIGLFWQIRVNPPHTACFSKRTLMRANRSRATGAEP